MSVVKKPVLWVVVLSFAIILLSAWILRSAGAAASPEIAPLYRSSTYPDGSTYTAEFHDDQFHIQWNWESRRETILSGLFEPVDKESGIYLLHDIRFITCITSANSLQTIK